MKSLIAVLLLMSAVAVAQSKTPLPPAPAHALPVLVSNPDAYLFPPNILVQLRALQYQSDQREILIQKSLVQIEHWKAEQASYLDQMKSIAYNYAVDKKIDLTLYEIEPGEMKFGKKKLAK